MTGYLPCAIRGYGPYFSFRSPLLTSNVRTKARLGSSGWLEWWYGYMHGGLAGPRVTGSPLSSGAGPGCVSLNHAYPESKNSSSAPSSFLMPNTAEIMGLLESLLSVPTGNGVGPMHDA